MLGSRSHTDDGPRREEAQLAPVPCPRRVPITELTPNPQSDAAGSIAPSFVFVCLFVCFYHFQNNILTYSICYKLYGSDCPPCRPPWSALGIFSSTCNGPDILNGHVNTRSYLQRWDREKDQELPNGPNSEVA